MTSVEAIKSRLTKVNQVQLLKFYEELNNEEKEELLNQLQTVDIEGANELFQKAILSLQENTRIKLDDKMRPLPESQFESEIRCSPELLQKYREIGLKEIAEGRVCALLLGGGQGTRLKVPYPKIMYSVGFPSQKTLGQIQAERIRRLQNLASCRFRKKCKIPWYIMTSESTRQATEDFLKKNEYFGLEEQDIFVFEQGVLPCFDMEGKILLEKKYKVALAPDGNGGMYKALYDLKVLDDMKKRGISYVHVHSVDNVLVKVADPVFIGYCVEKRADCAAKTVTKAGPTEAVGVICKVDEKVQVVEYSEISEKIANMRNDQGELVFNAGNICNHFFTVDFLYTVGEKYADSLKLHVAKKAVPFVDECGEIVKPSQPNAIKIERFIFDVFELSDRFVAWEVPRESEFSALKNTDDVGRDCPSTARNDLFRLHKLYIERAGGEVEGNVVEISPLLSYAGEDLEDLVKGKIFKEPVLLQAEEEKHKVIH